MTDELIRVRGARTHNLRDVDVELPRDRLVVFTGISGSGKSSLAFGTIYAEAQRRYLDSVAPYARRLIQQVATPQVRSVTGLPPAVAVQQHRAAPTNRSSVGTVSTLSNSLRMLFSRAGHYPPGAERVDSDAFSANTAAGACPNCHGVGTVYEATEQSLVPDPSRTIRDGAIASWPGAWQGKNLRDILVTLGYDVDLPWRELSATDRDWILFTDEQPVVTVHPVREASRTHRPYQGQYSSARRLVLHGFADSASASTRERLRPFLDASPCPVCHGRRLRPESLAVTVAGRDIVDMTTMPVDELAGVLRREVIDGGTELEQVLAGGVVDRIAALSRLGLGYLSADRATPTLSSGELQRLRVAGLVHSGLFGVVYVFDEPSAGLHPADTSDLLDVLDELRRAGNSILVVEHDPDVIDRADWVIDVGPGAGPHGGEVLYSGPVGGLDAVTTSITARYRRPTPPAPRDPRRPVGLIRMSGIRRHNLAVDVEIPLGVLTAVTGVSGSGKSTLIIQVLARALADRLDRAREEPPDDADAADAGNDDDDWDDTSTGRITGLDTVDRLVRVDQRPIGRTPRSNLATYTGLFDGVRQLFARTDEAKRRGYTASRFSFNVAAGRCPTCQGEGFVAVELLFLPGTYSVCPTCDGARYNPETLEIRYREHTVADVLALTVEQAQPLFSDVPKVARSLRTLEEVGLGYVRLGQPATELSGGEAQRIKLATELQRTNRRHTVYLLDEPTTGLHPADVERLMRHLNGLVDGGHTVIVIEHDLAVIAAADHLIDLGPGGGTAGGRIVAQGSPRDLAAADTPTGRHLAQWFVAAERPA